MTKNRIVGAVLLGLGLMLTYLLDSSYGFIYGAMVGIGLGLIVFGNNFKKRHK